MDAVEYIKARERMCAFYDTGCNCCPLVNRPYGESCDSIDPHGAVVLVEQWAKEHPVVTNAMKFNEVFRMEPINSNGIYLCPPRTVRARDCPDDCGKCRKWWDEEYKEPPKEET